MHCTVFVTYYPETEILTRVKELSMQTLDLIGYSCNAKKIPSHFLLLVAALCWCRGEAGQSWL